eukprot:2005895-Alexandrium_andersonii.AAC.1
MPQLLQSAAGARIRRQRPDGARAARHQRGQPKFALGQLQWRQGGQTRAELQERTQPSLLGHLRRVANSPHLQHAPAPATLPTTGR